ncbi:GIY-YIG nuclease family protein [Microbacterium sp. NPDC090003]|uniref:GIY-YIG nuclease family protein n=1 Tax=Microbacterium sp. NPDC090003 TaxID=3364203 RepID=UPI003815BC37
MGAVYVLHNCSMAGLVKIGMTTGTAEDRAKQLYTTGVPAPFVVLFSQPSRDPLKLERAVHEALAEFRDNTGREFFRVTPRRAIETIIAEAADDVPLMHPTAERDITVLLRTRWGSALSQDLTHARLKHTAFGTTLIADFKNSLGSRLSKTDLEIIWDDDAPFFAADMSVDEAAERFTELDAVTLLMTTDLLDPAVGEAIDDARRKGIPTERIDTLLTRLASSDPPLPRHSVIEEIHRLDVDQWGSLTPVDLPD